MAKAKPQSIDWQNRIVEYGQQSADQFLAHDLNARRHPNAQRDALRGSLNAVGWIAPVIVSQRSGKLLDGHARIEEALSRSESALVPYVLVDVSEAEEAIILGTFDPITGMATYDREVLDALLREIETNDAGLQSLLEELAAKNDLYLTDDAAKPSAGGDDFDTTPEETQTRVRYGDLWQCGEHRVLCGDSTKADDVARVMGGEKADMVFTDPPYGVAYSSGKKGAISGDLSQVAIPLSFKTAIDVATSDNARLYYCGGSTNCPMYFSLFDSYCHQMPHLLIWVKESFVMRPNNYHSQFEVIYFGWKRKGGSSDYWFGDRKASDIWQINRDKTGDYLHPTQKPVDIPMRAIGYSAPPKGIVFEPFGGSGSTLIACERTGRQCRAVELTPKYVNVILSRWEAETGREAKLMERLDG